MNKTIDKVIVGVFSIIALIAFEAGVFGFTWMILDIANEWWEPSPATSEVLQGMVNLHLGCGALIGIGVMAFFLGARVISAFVSVFPAFFENDDQAGRDE